MVKMPSGLAENLTADRRPETGEIALTVSGLPSSVEVEE
jgi:hypothetical protein